MKKEKQNSYISSNNLKEKARCLNCIMSSKRTDVHLNDAGICQLCEEYAKNVTPLKGQQIKWNEFVSVLQSKYSDNSSRYHCMALFSGGKDSTYMLHLLSQIPNFRIVAVTIDHWFNSPEAEMNVRRVLKNIPVDYINFRPAWNITQELYQQLVTKTGELCLACEGFLTTEIYNFAVELKIPCMAWGLSRQQFRTPPNWLIEIDFNYWNKMHKRFIESLGHAIGLDSELYKRFQQDYVPKFSEKKTFLPDLLFPFLALDYDPVDVELSAKKLGWQRPKDIDGISSNCYANHLHSYLKRKMQSINSLEDYLSDLVRKRIISRERALAVINTELDSTVPNEILSEIGLDLGVEELAESLVQMRKEMC